jgi:uncharacterized surface protein with fasciclin (FAS1) repeats
MNDRARVAPAEIRLLGVPVPILEHGLVSLTHFSKRNRSHMRNTLALGLSLAAAVAMASPAAAQMGNTDPMVGGQAMYPSKDIVSNAVNSPDHTTLVAAVKAAGLVETLQTKGPFTVFAPTNEAFAALPAGTVDNLVKPENKDALTKILTYHVIAGNYDAAALEKLIKQGGGTAQLKTVSGGTLSFMMNGPMNVVVKDEAGHVADISTYDVRQSNGVIHVVDRVLMPAT